MTEYVAFISYRHRQPDEAAAIRLHRMIEHYNIPADLRPKGRKRPGRVFRDEDELPLSTDLGESIRYALEHSEFLIAVCTPEYKKSRWCMEELDSFIAMHGRDRVLAVLVEGTPEESFPPQLLIARDEEGNEKSVEPLAANITAPTLRKSLRRLNTEKLRIIASLLGCSFDSLYQREKRYRQRRIMAVSALALAVAAVFVGMLLRKNAQIQAQYEETRKNMLRAQLNESAALTENARADLRLGRRFTALRTLLRALPEAPEQPYDTSAEGVLTEALRIYESPGYCFTSDITQYSDISAWILSEDGKTIFTWDSYGIIRAWTVSNGQLKWQHALAHVQKGEIDRPLIWCGETQSLLCFSLDSITMLSGEDGHEAWRLDAATDWSPITAFPDPAAGELLIVGDAQQDHSLLLIRVDLQTGEEHNRDAEGISGSYRYKTRLASVSSGRHTGFLEALADTDSWELVLVDMESMQVKHIPLREPYDMRNCEVRLSFTPGGQAVVSAVCKSSSKLSVRLRFFDPDTGEETAFMETAGYLRDTLSLNSCLACSDEYALVSAGNALWMFQCTDPDASPWIISLPGDVLELVRPDRANIQDSFMCALSSGLSSLILCADDSIYLTSDMEKYCFNAGFSYHSAQIDPQSLAVVAVPVNRRNELLVIRWEGSLPQMLETQAPYSNALLSPSGEKAYLEGNDAYALLSVPEDCFLSEGKLDTSAVSSNLPLGTPVFTSDESHVIRDQYIISLQDGKVEPLLLEEAGGVRPVSAWVPRFGKALTAVMVNDIGLGFARSNAFRLLLDGIPESECVSLPDNAVLDSSSFMATGLWTLGGNGLLLMSTVSGAQDPSSSSLLVYSTVDHAWLPVSGRLCVTADARAAAANLGNWFVLADREKLSLFDSASAVPVWETSLPFDSKAVSGIWPSPDDSLLLVTYGSFDVAVYRAADGQLLNTLSFSSPFSGVPHIQQDGNRLYLDPAGAGAASSCLVLDMESGSLVTSIPRPVFVNLRTNKAYLSILNESGLYLYPVYTKEELREVAEKRVSPAAE